MPRIYGGGTRRVRARLAQSLRGTSLGDDTIGAQPSDGSADPQTVLLQEMVASQKRIETAQGSWFQGDLFWKRVAVIATVMIPVTTGVWKWVVGRRRAAL